MKTLDLWMTGARMDSEEGTSKGQHMIDILIVKKVRLD